MVYDIYPDELRHHGIIGMKWGVRRFQNPDGSLTSAGRERYYGEKATTKFAKTLGTDTAVGRMAYRHSNQIKMISNAIKGETANAMAAADKCRKVSIGFDRMPKTEKQKWREVAMEKGLIANHGAGFKGNPVNDNERDMNMLLQGYRPVYSHPNAGGIIKSYYGDSAFCAWVLYSGDKRAKSFLANVMAYNDATEKKASICRQMIDDFSARMANQHLTPEQKETIYRRGQLYAEEIANAAWEYSPERAQTSTYNYYI